jgi:hypothetical protein
MRFDVSRVDIVVDQIIPYKCEVYFFSYLVKALVMAVSVYPTHDFFT